uniref:EB domain-containing protein n=1 Tax=Clastoptera arizonana TaxID=38151 RepID=A0A1B6DS60_9HEMI
MDLLVVYFCLLVPQFGQKAEGFEIGAPCEYDVNCYVENAFCRNQQVCECKKNFIPTEDRQICLAGVGAVCETKYDCTTLEHSDCQQNVCACEKGYVPDPTGTTCLPRTSHIKGPCQLDIQCQVSFGDMSHCEAGVCVCLPQHHFFNGRCFRSRGIEEFCNNNTDCYIGEDFIHTVNCKDGLCKCATGYIKDFQAKCQRGSAYRSVPSFLLTMVGIITGISGYIKRLFRGISRIFSK